MMFGDKTISYPAGTFIFARSGLVGMGHNGCGLAFFFGKSAAT